MADWVVFDIGCIECGERSAVIGVYANAEEADAAVEAAYANQTVKEAGSHHYEAFVLPERT